MRCLFHVHACFHSADSFIFLCFWQEIVMHNRDKRRAKSGVEIYLEQKKQTASVQLQFDSEETWRLSCHWWTHVGVTEGNLWREGEGREGTRSYNCGLWFVVSNLSWARKMLLCSVFVVTPDETLLHVHNLAPKEGKKSWSPFGAEPPPLTRAQSNPEPLAGFSVQVPAA